MLVHVEVWFSGFKPIFDFQVKSRSLMCLAAATAAEIAGHPLLADHARSGSRNILTFVIVQLCIGLQILDRINERSKTNT